MPVSPADFEFYSRVTGIPIPNDPVARMRMAPQVYAMRRGPMSRVKDALGAAAKAALVGGAAVGTGLLVKEAADRMGGSGSDKVTTSSTRDKAESLINAFTGSAPTAPRDEPEVEPTGTPVSAVTAAGFGSIEEARSSLQAKYGYGQRLSHQTEVPQADPNLENESFDAQRASVGEPVESLTTGRPEQAAPGLENVLAQAYEFYEAGEGARSATGKLLTPFQLKGAPQELSGHSRTRNREVKQFFDQYGIPLGSVPEKLRGGVASYLKNRGSDPAATPAQSEPAMRMAGSVQASPQGFTQKEANSRIVSLIKEGIEQLEGGKPSIEFEPGQSNKWKSMTLDPSGDIDVVFQKTPNTTYNYSVDPEASAAFEQIAKYSDEAGSAQRDPAFVTDKGRQVGDTLARAQEKKESKVTLGDIGQAALNVVKSAVTPKSAKRAARSAELDRTLAKGLGNLSPEQRAEKRDEILRKEGY